MEQQSARRAHTAEVAGADPAGATIIPWCQDPLCVWNQPDPLYEAITGHAQPPAHFHDGIAVIIPATMKES